MNADQEIAGQFSFLEYRLGARCVRSEYSAKYFGNAIVEFASPVIRIRVIKDRGNFLCDFAAPSDGDEWFDQEVVFRDLGEAPLIESLIAESWSSLDNVAKAVESNLERIVKLFSQECYPASRVKFLKHQQARVKRLFGAKVAEQPHQNWDA